MCARGTLEMVTLNGGSRCSRPVANTTRAARAVSAGTAKSLIWSTRPCGISACCALATFVAEGTISTRRPGSVTLVGSGASIADTLFPSAPWPPWSRTDTGIIETSGWSGSASWSRSQRRSAPAHMAITTSFTDTPKTFFTALTVSRLTLRKANRRCGVIGRVNGGAGAPPGPGRDHGTVAAVQPEHAADQRIHRRGQGRQHLDELVGDQHRLHRAPGQPGGRLDGQDGQGRRGGGPERLGRGQLAAVRREVEQDGQQLGAGGPVDRGVVDLGVDGSAILGQPGDQVELPQRPAAIARAGGHAARLL